VSGVPGLLGQSGRARDVFMHRLTFIGAYPGDLTVRHGSWGLASLCQASRGEYSEGAFSLV